MIAYLKKVLIMAAVWFIAAITPLVAHAGVENGRWLITARIAEATLLETKIGLPPRYSVKLRAVKAIQGSTTDFPATLNVELEANHIEVAKNAERIFAVVDFANGIPSVRYWESAILLACVPTDLIPSAYADRYFSEDWNSPNQKCTFADKYQPK